MINRVSEARLRDLSELNSSTEEGRMASELLAARSELQRLRTLIDGTVGNRTADELKHLKFSYSNQNQIIKEL
jgi:hypothetical protein